MPRRNRGKWALMAGSALLLATIGYVRAVKSAGNDETEARVVSPPDRAVLLSGNIEIIAQSPDGKLELDGKPCRCEPFTNPLCVTQVWLDPGVHELRIGNHRTEFVVALNEQEHDGPRDWKIYRFHPMESGESGDHRCGACHELQLEGDLMRVAGLPRAEACLECHDKAKLQAIESHRLQSPEACTTCHSIHGSPRKRLLKESFPESPGHRGKS